MLITKLGFKILVSNLLRLLHVIRITFEEFLVLHNQKITLSQKVILIECNLVASGTYQ